MRLRKIIPLSLLLFIGLILFSCSGETNPVTPDENEHILFGKVIDQEGNPVSGVNIHYVPSLTDTEIHKEGLQKRTSSTYIVFSIPEQTNVTLVLLKHSIKDTLSYLLKNELLNPGRYSITVNTDSLTNGIYDYTLKYGPTFIEENSFLIQKSPEELVSTIPLTVTDSEGRFQLNYNEFGIGNIFIIPNESPQYKKISDTIQIFLTKENYNNYLEPVVIDTNKATIKDFIFTKN